MLVGAGDILAVLGMLTTSYCIDEGAGRSEAVR